MRRFLLCVAVLLAFVALPAEAADQAVDVQDNRYVPPTVEVQTGNKVTWTQTGRNPHSVTATEPAGAFDSSPNCGGGVGITGCMSQGQKFEHTFQTPGTFRYACKIHGSAMSGTVVVSAAPTTTQAPTTTARPTTTAAPTTTARATSTTVPGPTTTLTDDDTTTTSSSTTSTTTDLESAAVEDDDDDSNILGPVLLLGAILAVAAGATAVALRLRQTPGAPGGPPGPPAGP